MADTKGMPPLNLPNGVSYVSREDYDRLLRTNWSTLKTMAKSPAHYRHHLINGREDSTSLKVGRAAHLAVLEPERYRGEVAVWDGGDRRGKEWTAFKAANAERDIIKQDEHELAMRLSQAVRTDAVAGRYLSGGRGEQTVLWTDSLYGVDCKGRVDFVAKCGALVDLKTTRDASPDGFAREAWKYQLHVQAAFYSDGYEAATGTRLPYVLVAVEKEPPHAVVVYRVPEAILGLGREEYRALLGRLEDCRRESHWPGYSTGELELTLPKWAVDFEGEDEDVGGLDLLIGGEANGL